jgi:hypothetical protein
MCLLDVFVGHELSWSQLFRNRGDGIWVIVATHAGAEVVRVEPFDVIDLELELMWGLPSEPGPPPSDSERSAE